MEWGEGVIRCIFPRLKQGRGEGSWVVSSSQGLESRAPYPRDTWPTGVQNQASLKNVAVESLIQTSKAFPAGHVLQELSQPMLGSLLEGSTHAHLCVPCATCAFVEGVSWGEDEEFV